MLGSTNKLGIGLETKLVLASTSKSVVDPTSRSGLCAISK